MNAPLCLARLPVLLSVSALAFAACTFDPAPRESHLVTSGAAGSTGSGGTGSHYISGTAGANQATGSGGTGPTIGGGGPGAYVDIPAGFTKVDTGAFQRGDLITNTQQTMVDSPM